MAVLTAVAQLTLDPVGLPAEAAGFGICSAGALGAASRSAQATQAAAPMVARKGRASYLGERSAGHRDPGSVSSALLFGALAEALGA